MRSGPIPFIVLVVVLLGLGGAYYYFTRTQTDRYARSRHVVDQVSIIDLSLAVSYDSGPLVREDYRMRDDDGVSKAEYRVLGRSGTQITVSETPRATLDPELNVAFFFDQVVHDGIWELSSKPPRGETGRHFEIRIAQRAGPAHGSRDIVFTDPHYWATTGGHQFTIKLHKGAPIPNLLQLSSTTLVEPRYAALVADFREFGPASFRDKARAARMRLGARA